MGTSASHAAPPPGTAYASTLRAAWYRTRATFARRRGGYLAVVLLLGLVGGLALGAVAAARRTQSSFPAYLASTHPADLTVFDRYLDPAIGDDTGYAAAAAARIAHLPHVERADTIVGFDANLDLPPSLHLHLKAGEQPPAMEGSPDGEFATQDKVTVVAGHMADPKRVDQVMVNAEAARVLGMHVGSTVRIAFDTDAQLFQPDCCSFTVPPPRLTMTFRLVGIVLVEDGVLEDDSDALSSQIGIFTPTLTRELEGCCSTYMASALRIDGGSRLASTVQREVDAAIGTTQFDAMSSQPGPAEDTVERSIRPEALALGIFGAIAGLAALLITGQVIGRQLRLGAGELEVLRALGAGPGLTLADGLIGVLVAVVVGSVLAAAVAVVLSPLAPVGPVRPVYPTPGVDVDWAVLGLGGLAFVVLLGVAAVLLASRAMPHRAAVRRRVPERPSAVTRAALSSGLPAPAVTGIRFALEPGRGRNAVPVRSAIVGTVLAITVLSATFTFGASLDALVSHPALYGWNWNYAMVGGFAGDEDLPQPEVTRLLDQDPSVTAWSGVYFDGLRIDGQTVPVMGAVLGTGSKPAVGPALLSGHGVRRADQIVLGPITLAALRKRVGETVSVSAGGKPRELTIVGTATLPAIGNGGNHTEMGSGAFVSSTLIPATARNLQQSPVPGPEAVLVRVRGGQGSVASLRSLQHVNAVLGASPDSSGGVLSVLRPAEIVNYRTIETAPALLGGALAAGAVVALGLTLVASVRRRRRDLALLKTVGFTRRQLGSVVAWQSSVAVVIGVVVGVTAGIVVGRLLWDLFAHGISAVPVPVVPIVTMVAIGVGALLLANVVAALPGRIAARTPTAVLLRSE